MTYVIWDGQTAIEKLMVLPGHVVTLTDASGTSFFLDHEPGIYFGFRVTSCFVDGEPAYPVILRVIPTRKRFHPSRPEA